MQDEFDLEIDSSCGVSAPDNSVDLKELKKEKINDKLLKVAFKEIILNLIFAGVVLAIAYQMIDIKVNTYQNNLKNIFGAGDKSTSFLDVIYFICVKISNLIFI